MKLSNQLLALGFLPLCLLVASTVECQQPTTGKSTPAGQQAKPAAPEKYRVVKKEDGLSCSFSQDLSISMGYGTSGTASASANHFTCLDKAKKEVEIELVSKDPNTNVVAKEGKIGILTKKFGTVYRGNEADATGTYEMTDTQIKQLKAFLGL